MKKIVKIDLEKTVSELNILMESDDIPASRQEKIYDLIMQRLHPGKSIEPSYLMYRAKKLNKGKKYWDSLIFKGGHFHTFTHVNAGCSGDWTERTEYGLFSFERIVNQIEKQENEKKKKK